MNHQICGSSISAANKKSTAFVIIGSGAVQPRPSRIHVIKRATRMPLIPIPSIPDSARSKLVLDSSSCLNSQPQAAAKVQISVYSNLHANLIKFVCKGGPKSQGLSSCSLAKLRLNKVAILVNEPLVAEGHDHGLTATQQSPWQSSYGYHTSHTTHWQREICQFWSSPHPPWLPRSHAWPSSLAPQLAAAGSCWLLLAADAEALAEESPPGASFLERQAPTPSWHLMWLVLTHSNAIDILQGPLVAVMLRQSPLLAIVFLQICSSTLHASIGATSPEIMKVTWQESPN